MSAKTRGKAFTIHAKLISIAASRGADPTLNTALAEAITKAKKDNVPNDNIDRAIQRGAGLEKGAVAIEEVLYEGYGAGGVAIIIRALTDNRNRTAPSIRHAFSKCGGSLGETGSVSNFAFRFIGQIIIAGRLTDIIEEQIMESGAADYREEDDTIIIETAWHEFTKVRDFLLSKNLILVESGGTYIPTTLVELGEFDKALKVHSLIETLEEDEDVESVWHNASIPEDIQKQILEQLEHNRFRT